MSNISEKKLKIGISADFLKAYAKISKQNQNSVRRFIEKFKGNPASPGAHYEKIKNASDPNLRSVRINRQYRAIVLKPEKDNVYMLLWVDNHDDAYEWAMSRRFQIHPETGALQVLDISDAEVHRDKAEKTPEQKSLFAEIRDRELIRLGVPEDLLPKVRSIKTDEELESESANMPEEVFEVLYMLAAGYSQNEVYQECISSEKRASVDTNNFSAALEQADSQRRFALIEDDLELQEMLAAPLERWRIFLHPSQRKIVKIQANGPVRVLGGAGTGKTVVAMHRTKWLAENIFTKDNDHILVTTFTRNLATDFNANLHKLCSPNIMRRIEVINIDAWVSRFLKQNGYDYTIAFERQLEPLWENALNLVDDALELPEQFYVDEWEQVIQEQGIQDLASYLHANRTGRGHRLSRRIRPRVWPVFEEYRSQLNDMRYKELVDAVRDARHLLERRGDILPYRSIVVDEAQDMGTETFKLIRQMIPTHTGGEPNDIFITGDAHQRIYGHKLVLSHCGINIRGRSRKLRINYRTTDETRGWALNLLKDCKFDDLDGAEDSQKGYKSLLHGPAPVVRQHKSFAHELEEILNYLSRLKECGVSEKTICLVARTNDVLAQYSGALQSNGSQVCKIHRSSAEDRKAPGVRLATMHRVKGLEFEYVIIAGVNEGIVPLEKALAAENPYEKVESEKRERSLLYVSATRAKKEVLLTCSGKPSRFINAAL